MAGDLLGVRLVQALRVADQRDIRIDAGDRAGSAFGLGFADLLRFVQHLALQVRQRDHVVIHHPDGADTGRGQIEDGRRAEPACANHQNPCRFQALLARAADLVQNQMPGVAFEFVFGEGHGHSFGGIFGLGGLPVPGRFRTVGAFQIFPRKAPVLPPLSSLCES